MKRMKSLLVLLGVYLVALFFAIAYLYHFDYLGIFDLLIATCISTFVVFVFSCLYNNPSLYDPYWSVQPIFLVGAMYAFLGLDFDLSQLIVLIPLLLWALRLTYNCLKTFSLSHIDWRYKQLKAKTKKLFPLVNLFGIMMFPTILVFFGTLPLFYAFSAVNYLFYTLSGLIILKAVVIQFVADHQLAKFKANPFNHQECINIGLWKLSRHPNYLGEIILWGGVALASLGVFNWYSLLGFILMVLLFNFISIPLMEKHLAKKRPSYKEYCQVTSRLIPFSNKVTHLFKS